MGVNKSFFWGGEGTAPVFRPEKVTGEKQTNYKSSTTTVCLFYGKRVSAEKNFFIWVDKTANGPYNKSKGITTNERRTEIYCNGLHILSLYKGREMKIGILEDERGVSEKVKNYIESYFNEHRGGGYT